MARVSKVKPFAKTKKAKVNNKLVPKPKIETPETDVMRRILTLKDTFFPYGRVGLVNYGKKVKKGFTELDILYPESLPPTKLSLQNIVDVQRKNFFTIYNSGWRLMYPTNYGLNVNSFSNYDGMVNRVHVLSLNDLFVSFHDRQKLWYKHHEKIFDAMPYDLDRFAKSFHSTRTIVLTPENMYCTKELVNFFYAIWRRWKFPLSDYPSHISFRFYMFTSSIRGETVREKLKEIESFGKYFKHMVCLIGNDMPINDLAVLAKYTEARCTFDPFKCKDAGKFITADNPFYVRMLKYSTPKASSLNPSPLFMNESFIKDNDPKAMKVFKHYSRISNVVLY